MQENVFLLLSRKQITLKIESSPLFTLKKLRIYIAMLKCTVTWEFLWFHVNLNSLKRMKSGNSADTWPATSYLLSVGLIIHEFTF